MISADDVDSPNPIRNVNIPTEKAGIHTGAATRHTETQPNKANMLRILDIIILVTVESTVRDMIIIASIITDRIIKFLNT